MRTRLVFVVVCLCAIAPGVAFAATNDDFADATVVSSIPFEDSVPTAGTTVQNGEPAPCGVVSHTIWYRFTPTTSASLKVEASGDTGARFAIFTGEKLRRLTNVTGCASSRTLPLAAGTTYRIQVSTSAEGAFGVRVSTPPPPPPPPPPINDEPAGAHLLVWDPIEVEFFGVTDGATVSAHDPDPGCTTVPIQDTVWYRLTAEDLVFKTFEISTFSFNPFVAAYVEGPDGEPAGPAIACAQADPDAFAGGVARTEPSVLTPGTTYLIQVGAVASPNEGMFSGFVY